MSRPKANARKQSVSSSTSVTEISAEAPLIPERWKYLGQGAPLLLAVLAPAFQKAPEILDTDIHVQAVLSILLSRPERFHDPDAQIPLILPDQIIGTWSACEEDYRKRPRQCLSFRTMSQRLVFAWPLLWKSFRALLPHLPQDANIFGVEQKMALKRPDRAAYFQAVATLIAIARST